MVLSRLILFPYVIAFALYAAGGARATEVPVVEPAPQKPNVAEEVRRYGVHGRPDVPDGTGLTGPHRRDEAPPRDRRGVRSSANGQTDSVGRQRGPAGATGGVLDRRTIRSWH